MRLARSRTAMTSLRSTNISHCPLFDPAAVRSDQHTLRANHLKQVLHEVVELQGGTEGDVAIPVGSQSDGLIFKVRNVSWPI
jgi:hypothetical protein